MARPATAATSALAAALFLALAAAPASAGPGTLGQLTASHVRAEGITSAIGPMAGLELVGDGATLLAGSLLLQGQSALVEIYTENGTILLDQTLLPPDDRNATQELLTDFTLLASGVRPGQAFQVVRFETHAQPTAELEAECLEARPTAEETILIRPRTDAKQGDEVYDVADALQWEDCARSPRLRIEGSFRVAVWEWDLEVSAAEGERSYRTGTTRSSSVPGPGNMTVQGTYTKQEVYLNVTNGSLELGPVSSDVAFLYLSRLDLQAARLTFDDAAGELSDGSGRRAVQAPEVVLDGELRASLVRQKDAIAAALSGTPTGATIGGESAGWVVPPAAKESWWSRFGWLAVGAVAAPVATGGGVVLHRRWQRGTMEDIEVLMAAGQYTEVERRARLLLLGGAAFRQEALLLQSQAVAHLGRPDEALRLADGVAGTLGDFLRAYVHAVRGDAASSIAWLARALPAGPEFAAEVLRNPAFSQVRRDPRLAPLLRVRPQEGWT